ncbi:MAG TPA: RDD family protein [Pyrinomonadaceae bacterium]|nr:RDD family protein [Pyrinomonadaceae bacterium]
MESSDVSAAHGDEPAYSGAQGSKLIEFPGASRSTVPQWRKELSERVREVQEKRAREEALDLSLEKRADLSESLPQLELLPQAEAAPVNPLVAAALRRIERAHDGRVYAGNSSGSSAVAYAAPMLQDDTAVDEVAPLAATICAAEELQPHQTEKAHNLVVVPTPPIVETTIVPKPKRMIGDINDPALNYLDSVCTATRLETSRYKRASVGARLVSAFVDLAVVTLLCAPFAAALELTDTNWQVPRTWMLAAGVFSLVGFLYFTVSTALTGRTLGLKLLSLRIVDVRTGLIPTGTQSAGRALIYQASLILLGITSVLALLNPERLTAHDRITRTAVVQS